MIPVAFFLKSYYLSLKNIFLYFPELATALIWALISYFSIIILSFVRLFDNFYILSDNVWVIFI